MSIAAKILAEKEDKGGVGSAFMNVLDYLQRGQYASANLASDLIAGEFDPINSIKEGLSGKVKANYGDVLEQIGWSPDTTAGKVAKGTAGFALDVLADPLTYVGIGALTKGGKVAKGAGKLAPTAVAQANAGQRALLQFAGKPLVKGNSVFKMLTRADEAIKTSKLTKPFADALSTVGMNPKLHQLKSQQRALKRYLETKPMKEIIKARDEVAEFAKKAGLKYETQLGKLADAVELGNPSLIPKGLQGAYNTVKKWNKYALRVEKMFGVPTSELSGDIDYLGRFLSDDGFAFLNKKFMGNSAKRNSGEFANQLQRVLVKKDGTIPTLLEAEEMMKAKGFKGDNFFIKDPLLSTVYRNSKTARAVSNGKLLRDAVDMFSVDEGIKAKKVFSDLGFKNVDKLNDIKIPESIAKELTAVVQKSRSPEAIQDLTKIYDNVLNWWKAWTLSPFPAYHVRNAIGNMWNNYLGDVKSPRPYKKAFGIFKDKILQGKSLSKADSKLYRTAAKLGVIGEGQYAIEAGQETAEMLAKTSANPLSRKGWLMRGGQKVGQLNEDLARFAHYIDKIDKGYKPEQAAMSVKKYLFDYTDYTDVEASLRKLAPFYLWSRKNIPLQIETLIKRPAKIGVVGKAVNEFAPDTRETPISDLPEWIRDKAPIVFGKGNEATVFPLESWIPSADISRVMRPDRMAIELASPIIKTPVELAMNKSAYFDSPIRKYPGATDDVLGIDLPAKTAYTAKQIRMVNEIDRLIRKKDDDVSIGLKALRLGTGIKTYSFDKEKQRYYNALGQRKILQDLKVGLARAIKAGRNKEVDRIKKRIVEMGGKID